MIRFLLGREGGCPINGRMEGRTMRTLRIVSSLLPRVKNVLNYKLILSKIALQIKNETNIFGGYKQEYYGIILG